jgi:hypothetical protein
MFSEGSGYFVENCFLYGWKWSHVIIISEGVAVVRKNLIPEHYQSVIRTKNGREARF